MLRALFALSLLFGNSGKAGALETSAVEIYDLEETLHKAGRNSAALQSTAQDVKIAEERVKEARMLFFPEVGLQGSATRFRARRAFSLRPDFGTNLLFPSNNDNFFSGQAYASIPLYAGRRNINTFRLAQTALKRARSKHQTAKLDLAYRIKQNFYRFLLAQAVVDAAEELQTRIKLTDRSKSFTAAVVRADLRTSASDARRRLELARLDFLKGLNRELDTPIKVVGKLETQSVDIDLQKALIWSTELRPELQSRTYRSQMDAIAVNLALGRRIPTVVLGVDYEIVGEKFPLRQNNWDATVAVRLPFALNFWTQHRQRVAEQRQGEIRRSELRDTVHLEVRKAHQNLQFWAGEWLEREKEFRELRRLYDAAGTSAGLDGATSVLRAQWRFLEAVTEHLLSRARLERAIGRTIGDPS